MKKEKVYCEKCKWFSENLFLCDKSKTSVYFPEIGKDYHEVFSASCLDVNAKNNCKYFENKK